MGVSFIRFMRLGHSLHISDPRKAPGTFFCLVHLPDPVIESESENEEKNEGDPVHGYFFRGVAQFRIRQDSGGI